MTEVALTHAGGVDPLAQELRLIGVSVRRRRMEQALTQRALAKLSGLDVSSISYLERGVRRARISTIYALAKALKCSPLDIARIVDKD